MKHSGNRWFILLISAIAAAILAIGCGGGSGAGGGTGNRVNLFVTDNLRAGYDAVFVTIYRIELVDNAGGATQVFDDPAGKEVNVRRLNDGVNNLYLFIGSTKLDSTKVFSSVRVTMGNQINALRSVSNSYDALTVVGEATGTSGRVLRTFNLAPPRSFSADDEFCIDFDLANFLISGSNVTPVLEDSPRSGIDDDDRHESDEIKGTISNFAGISPNFTFTLTTRSGAVEVQTNASTAVFNSNGNPNPVMANGKRVEVDGFFDTTTNRFVASKVKIKTSSESDDPAEAEGFVGTANAVAGSFTLQVFETEGFLPPAEFLNVQTNASTRFRNDGGISLTKDEFFAQILTKGISIEVEGSYVAGVFTATKCKIDDESDDDDDPNESEVKGLASAINPGGGQITVNAPRVEGFQVPSGTAIIITTSYSTKFSNSNDDNVSAGEFFEALLFLPANQRFIEAEGTWNGTTFEATELKIEDD